MPEVFELCRPQQGSRPSVKHPGFASIQHHALYHHPVHVQAREQPRLPREILVVECEPSRVGLGTSPGNIHAVSPFDFDSSSKVYKGRHLLKGLRVHCQGDRGGRGKHGLSSGSCCNATARLLMRSHAGPFHCVTAKFACCRRVGFARCPCLREDQFSTMPGANVFLHDTFFHCASRARRPIRQRAGARHPSPRSNLRPRHMYNRLDSR